MTRRETLRQSAALFDQMASTLGVDLEEAALARCLSVDEISDAVLRCSDCPNPAHCKTFLKRNQQSEQTPEYCRNRDLLSRLRP